MTSIVNLSQKVAENFSYSGDWVCISITSTSDKIAEISCEYNHLRDLLRVHFHDIDGPASGMNLITVESARKIASFLKLWYGRVPLIVVHCHAGISRSAAVSAAFNKYFNNNDSLQFNHFCPNMTVYRRVLDALNE